ncbi:uncharacterized protein TNCV_3510841 [Trichonephila clavipes]|nr:uncharacterized protein TNCV_3510841 [Trichonephila clavipes]
MDMLSQVNEKNLAGNMILTQNLHLHSCTQPYKFSQQSQNNSVDITVSYDGTWHKRGYTSLYSIGIVIDAMTNLVVDFDILSKYCHECGSMEMHDAYILWNRSISDYAMRYTTVLCDGDAKTHQHLNEKKVYVDDVTIVKEECANYVVERLGTVIRNKVRVAWERKANVDNVPEVDNMKTSILATLFHCMSTDAKPMHSKCPEGKLSWSFYHRAKVNNKVPGSHKSMKTKLSEEVVAKIMPVYQRLASKEILLRCVSGKTQNANESLHSCIWRKFPKDLFVSKRRIDLAVMAVISKVNIGYVETLK